jgi:hypothetical protein
MKSSFVLLLMAIVAAAPASSRATTFYLDSVRGNDSAPGTSGSVALTERVVFWSG